MSVFTDGELPQGAEKVERVENMFDRIAPSYDRVNRVMTFGLDQRWRKRTLREIRLTAGDLFLDLACGTGDFSRLATDIGAVAVGIDRSAGMIAHARTTACLVRGDILRLPVPTGSIDSIACGFALRNVIDVAGLFLECGRVLRPGGRLGLLEVAEPESKKLAAIHHFYFHRVVPKIGGWISGQRDAYEYLPKSVAYLPEPRALLADVREAGFHTVRRTLLGGGGAQLITAVRA
ncbi:MAG: ubiquinone/menaquinone biosynthesis methyltransferase [Acidimicrobiia bacterium]